VWDSLEYPNHNFHIHEQSLLLCREVEKLAALNNIHLRTGCFCNPGACAMHLGLSAADLQAHHAAGHVCWDDHDVIDGR
jgi:molybdenum cofactor sulfurtransferase